jgi:GNAT superfamily N-acetyltransferase
MEYIQATGIHLDDIFNLVQDTIRSIYPRYYPKEVADFFCAHHSKEAIQADIDSGNVWVLLSDTAPGNVLVGTGSRKNNQITRIYVAPAYQGHGHGSIIMQQLEDEIGKEYHEALLDSSLAARRFYENRGYRTISHERLKLENGVILVYEVMRKALSNVATAIGYEGRRFVSKINAASGEVDDKTIFHYHQSGKIVWADYSGGNIVKGFLLGISAQDGTLDFHYQHINIKNQVRIGKCHSVPHVLEDGKLKLREEWQWLNGGQETGSSIIVEQ